MMESLEICPLCASREINFFLSAKDFLVTQKEFSISKCSKCSFTFTNPRPDAQGIKAYYESEDYISHEDSKTGIFAKTYQLVKKRMLRKKAKLIESCFKKKTINILDYGCGTGDFLKECKKRNWLTIGIEPDIAARNRAISKGVNVLNSISALSNLPQNVFDVITFWHSLEHIHDFKSILSRLSELLTPEGIFVIAIPEYKSFDAKFFKSFWAAYDLPRHLSHFEESTLKKCLVNVQFELNTKKGLVFDSYYISILSEKNKSSNKVLAYLKGLIVGFVSNISAKFQKAPYSSQIYVFRKLAK